MPVAARRLAAKAWKEQMQSFGQRIQRIRVMEVVFVFVEFLLANTANSHVVSLWHRRAFVVL